MFSALIQFSLLFYNQFSPSCFLYLKNKCYLKYETYLNTEVTHFNYGYISALNLVVLSIVFVYSIHIPLVVLLGILYFLMRLACDSFSMNQIFKKDIESSGDLIVSTLNRIVFSLGFF